MTVGVKPPGCLHLGGFSNLVVSTSKKKPFPCGYNEKKSNVGGFAVGRLLTFRGLLIFGFESKSAGDCLQVGAAHFFGGLLPDGGICS